MNQNGYKITSSILQELSLAKTIKHVGKGIGRNLKKDKTSAALATAGFFSPIPGGEIPGIAMHLTKSKGSRMKAAVLGRKLFQPHKWMK